MTRQKGFHIFEKEDLVLPNPVISRIWQEAKISDIGVVLDFRNKTKYDDHRMVQVYWPQTKKTCFYASEFVYPLHQEEKLLQLCFEFDSIVMRTKNGTWDQLNLISKLFKNVSHIPDKNPWKSFDDRRVLKPYYT